jgi:transposase
MDGMREGAPRTLQPRRQFTAEFKLEAVRLAMESGKPQHVVAAELGIRSDQLRKWRRRLEARGATPTAPRTPRSARDVFPGHGQLTSQDEELRRLKRELEVVRQERDFLKRAAAFFAKASR